MIFNTADWSDMFGVSSRHIRRLIHDGVLPKCVGDITQDRALETIKTFLEYKSPDPAQERLIEQRTRLVRLRADRLELANKQLRSSLLRTKEAQAVWGGLVVVSKRRCRRFPDEIAKKLCGKEKPEIQHILQIEVDRMLTDLADPDLKEVAKYIDPAAFEKPRKK